MLHLILSDVSTRREAQLYIEDMTNYGFTPFAVRNMVLELMRSEDSRTRKGAEMVLSEIDRKPFTFIQFIGGVLGFAAFAWFILFCIYVLG